MDRNSIVSFIAAEISTISGVAFPVDETSILDDLPLDSLQCLELTAQIEDAYDIEISCSDRISLVTVGDFADLVMKSPSSISCAA